MAKGGNIIAIIFTGMIMIAVLGWVTGTVITSIPDNGDVLGVQTGIQTYGPVIVTILLIGFFVMGVGVLLRYLL